MPYRSILIAALQAAIANRGEIAVRIIRACRELGIASVAVFSEADQTALHTRLADEAIFIGPPAPRDSYLSIEKLLAAARKTGAQAIHPGYGFLSENADFAQAVKQNGLIFIGPSAEAIREMGDKSMARLIMQAAGIPVVPGYQEQEDLAGFQSAAQKIGYPVLVKAAAGGGGKGMRVVNHPVELESSMSAARREALHAFAGVLERIPWLGASFKGLLLRRMSEGLGYYAYPNVRAGRAVVPEMHGPVDLDRITAGIVSLLADGVARQVMATELMALMGPTGAAARLVSALGVTLG